MELRNPNGLIVQELLKEFRTGYSLGQDAVDIGENIHHVIMATLFHNAGKKRGAKDAP